MIDLIKMCLAGPLVLMVVGCVNSPRTSNYYLIESHVKSASIDSTQRIVLYPIQLSDYLRSTNLHVKSESGEILYSATDLWAERPSKMLWRVMQQNLEEQTGHHVLKSHQVSNSCAQIKVQINELSSNVRGEVISSGRWFVSAGDKKIQTNKFFFSGNISVDGYSAANKLIAGHLHELSNELEQQIESLGLCQSA